MPPKNKKEEEAARLAEEEKRRQMEEQLIQEENRKYGCTKYKTEMLLPITQYIIEEVNSSDNQTELLREYLCKILERCDSNHPRDIDIEIAVEQLVNDFQTCQELVLQEDAALVFINMMFLVYVNQHEKFGKLIDSKGVKTQQGDRKLFYKLVGQHSTDGYNCHKVFVAKQLLYGEGYGEYVTQGYLSHWLLLMQAHSFNQRPLEIQVDLQIELPLPQPLLDDNMYYKPIVVEEEQSIKRTEAEDVEEQYHEPTDEELLDSIILKAIEQKIIIAEEELNEKLKERQEDIENKLQEMAVAATKKKK